MLASCKLVRLGDGIGSKCLLWCFRLHVLYFGAIASLNAILEGPGPIEETMLHRLAKQPGMEAAVTRHGG